MGIRDRIWDALWPNEFGMTSVLYSLCYNGSYMLPEIVITAILACILAVSYTHLDVYKRQVLFTHGTSTQESTAVITIAGSM